MTTAVGTVVQAGTAGTTTLSLNPTAKKNFFVLGTGVSAANNPVTGVTGGNCDWYKLTGDNKSASGVLISQNMWLGIANATGAQTMTVTAASSLAGTGNQLIAQQFSPGFGDQSRITLEAMAFAIKNEASGTALVFDAFAPITPGCLDVRYVIPQNTGSGGSGTGWVFQTDDFTDRYAYHLNAVQPSSNPGNAVGSAKGNYAMMGVLLKVDKNTGLMLPT